MRSIPILAMAVALLLCGCGPEYVYTPPATAEGRACAAQCQATQLSCRSYQDRNAAAATAQCTQESAYRQNQCEQGRETQYTACLRFARTDSDRAACDKDRHRQSCDQPICVSGSSYALCDRDYRGCFENCGGQVGILKQ